MLSEVSTGPSSKRKIALAAREATRGAPGAIGRFVRKTCAPADSAASFARLREVIPLPVPGAPLFEKHRAARCRGRQFAERELEGAVFQGQAGALGVVGRACAYFARGAASTFELPDWNEVIAAKNISYASVEALDIADPQVGAWLAGPALALLPRAERPQDVPRAAIQVEPRQEWYQIGAKLVELGRATPIAEDRVFKVGGRKVLAGPFGAAKGGAPSPGQARARRLSVNMVPANSFQCIMREPSRFQRAHLALRVIPMGWISAVTVFQHCHRRLGCGARPLAAGLEWREDQPLPFKSKVLEQQCVQYCNGDWGHGEVASSCYWGRGPPTAYHRSGTNVAPDKAKHRALVLERMCAGLDGAFGRVGVTTEELHLLVGFILWAMGQSALSPQAMLNVLGRCVRAAEFRRPFMGFLNSVWAAGSWARPRPALLGICDELPGFAFALPLAFTALRARIDACVSATGASEHAGGICYAIGLSEQGVACAKGEASAAALRPGAISAPVQGVDPAARRLARRRWAGVVEPGNIEAVGAKRFSEMRFREGPRSRLFYRVPELIEAAEAAFPKRTMWLVENVFSMSLESRAEFSRVLGVAPIFLGARFLARVRRPRLCWRSWPVVSFLASDAAVGASEGAAARFKVALAVKLERAPPAAAQRRVADGYRYQVNNYEDGSLVRDAQRERGRLRAPEERGALMGFDHLYFQAAAKDNTAPSERDVTIESLIGNTFCSQVITYPLGSWLARVGVICAAMPGQSCLAVGACQSNWNVAPDFQRPGHRDPQLERGLIVEFLRVADRGGADVRLGAGAPCRARAWPRAVLRAHLRAWRIANGFRWQRAAHMSALELEAVVAGARWRCRAVEGRRCRCPRILDAYAIAAVNTKGRSSARALQPALRRLNSLLLATAGCPLHGYCDTGDMPVDALLRRRFGSNEGEAGSSQDSGEACFSEGHAPAGVSAFIESRWLNGGSLFEVNNAVAGVAREFPPVRGHHKESWRLAKTRQRLEPDGRALPIGPLIAAACDGAFAAVGQLGAAATLAAGFDIFLRTGEMTSLAWSDVQLYPARRKAVLQLRSTTSQRQTGAREFVLVRSAVAVAPLAKAEANARQSDLCLGMEPNCFVRIFSQVRELLELQDTKLTLHSWRRGGASAVFHGRGSMGHALFRG
ncbi:unnamed protein product, partial [Prorocentrum cordatum]